MKKTITIEFNPTSLQGALNTLEKMYQSGSGMNTAGRIVQQSLGSTADALNAQYQVMRQLEAELLRLIEKTANALRKGGAAFEAADKAAAQTVRIIDGEDS